jgi:hypothetical protein
MPSAVFEPAIPAIKRPQAYALESRATGIGASRGYRKLLQHLFKDAVSKLGVRWECD